MQTPLEAELAHHQPIAVVLAPTACRGAGAGERVTFGDLLDIERQEAELVWKAQGASR